MISKSCKALSIATIGATLLLQGCTPNTEEDEGIIPQVNVPKSLENPSEFAGTWAEAGGMQVLVLKQDGSANLKNKAKISAQGVNRTMDTETPCKWGVQAKKFYFHGFANNGLPLEYDFVFEDGKLVLSQKAVKSKLIYSKSSK